MSRVKVDWQVRPSTTYRKDIELDRFERYLKGLGLKSETIKLYVGRVGAFLDYAKSDLPSLEIVENYRSKLIEDRLSNGHINNTCFGIKKFYQMNDIAVACYQDEYARLATAEAKR